MSTCKKGMLWVLVEFGAYHEPEKLILTWFLIFTYCLRNQIIFPVQGENSCASIKDDLYTFIQKVCVIASVHVDTT